MASFDKMAAIMDSVTPVRSLRELAARHRWPNGLPPVVSLRMLNWRHDHPDTSWHRLLWLNTWLIQGFPLSLCNTVHIGRIMAVLGPRLKDWFLSGMPPAKDLIDKFDLTSTMLADAFDLSKDVLANAFPDIANSFVKAVTKWVPWPINKVVEELVAKPLSEVTRGEILGKLSPHQLVDEFEFMTPDQIITKVGLDAGQVAAAFCGQLAGWLSDATGWPIDFTWITIGEQAPNREARAKAMGQMFSKNYDIASLCEVFEPSRRADILKAAGETGRKASGYAGPEADGEIAGSGLLTVAFDGRGLSKKMRVFSNQGDHVRDADAWSRKGVLLTVVNVGVGKIDLYTTHLYQGGDTPFKDPTDAQRWAVKLSQIDEIVSFIGETHNADHVAVLMGDFNVAAHDPEYKTLLERLATVGLVDLWPFWREAASNPGLKKPPSHRGATNDPALCEVKTPGMPLCAEPGAQEGPGNGRRIDCIFVEKPRANHAFTVDFTRMRRRGDQFSGSKLSDHLGLDVKLIVSPHFHLPA